MNNAILKLTAYNVLAGQSIVYMRMSFFEIAHQALHYDMIAHVTKVLDAHPDARGLAYIRKVNNAAVVKAAAKCDINLAELDILAVKLKHIRDKTHFHIDADTLKDSKAIWKTADISGELFVRSLNSLAVLLSEIRFSLFGGERLEVTEYDGSDIPKIVKAFEKVHGDVHGA